MLVLHEVV